MTPNRFPTSADRERIACRLDELWSIARGPAGGADRPAYSAAEAQAMRLVAGWAREHGLSPAIDAYGNLWALPDAEGPVVTAGSHVDTVPDGGRYDGALGTVLGLELVDALSAAARGSDPGAARAGLLVCAAEEAPRFGAGTMGSRLMVGKMKPPQLASLRDTDGVTAADALAGYLAELADLPRIDSPLSRLRAHAEIHVAQRRVLRELGVVTRVASPRRFVVDLTGSAGHSGEVSMADRRDALAAAAEVVLAVEAAARAEPLETVATVGTLTVDPGAISVVPGHVRLGVDVRGVDAQSLERVERGIRDAVAGLARSRGIDGNVALVRAGAPVLMNPVLVDEALQAAGRLGIAATATWSGAGHDAQHVTEAVPALLLFVPLHGGESHTPDEGADMDEIVQAAAVAAEVLRDVCARGGVG